MSDIVAPSYSSLAELDEDVLRYIEALDEKAERLDAEIEELRAANKKMHHALKSIARQLETHGGHSEPDSGTAYIVAMNLVADDLLKTDALSIQPNAKGNAMETEKEIKEQITELDKIASNRKELRVLRARAITAIEVLEWVLGGETISPLEQHQKCMELAEHFTKAKGTSDE